jgi:2-keto-4-pentenoate hydratase
VSDDTVIAAFAAARMSQKPLAALPEPEPPDLERAFDLQCAIAGVLGWRQIGWKIGCTSLGAQRALGAPGPIAGNMFANRFHRSGDFVPTIAENKRVAEPEIAFTMARSLPPRGKPYDRAEVLAAVASVHPGIEVVSPRTPRGFDDPYPWFIVDGSVNDSMVLGEARKPMDAASLASIRATATCAGKSIGDGVGANALGGPDIVLCWIANYLNDHGLQLAEGDVVTTGVITPIFSAALGDMVEANFEGLGKVTCRF